MTFRQFVERRFSKYADVLLTEPEGWEGQNFFLQGAEGLASIRGVSEKPVDAVLDCQLSFVAVLKFFSDLDTKYRIV